MGFQRKDRQGQEYWKYKPLTKAEGVVSQTESTPPPSEIKPENQPNSKENRIAVSAEQVPARSVEESEAVKKFREKFGEFSASEQSSTAKQKYGNPNQKPVEK